MWFDFILQPLAAMVNAAGIFRSVGLGRTVRHQRYGWGPQTRFEELS